MALIESAPFLSGNYAPVSDEVVIDELEVQGALPVGLDGRYLRTGPNPVAPVQPYHWFLGDGMVHGIALRGGRAVRYRNRWVRTGPVSEHLGEPPVDGPPQPQYDLSNTTVVGHAGRVLSITEGCYPYELSPELETLRRADFGGVLPHGLTAHPWRDVATGELHAFSYWFEEPYLIYHVIDASGRLRVTEPITLPAPVSMHNFAITPNYVLFFDQPALFDLDAYTTTGFPYSWKPENGARIGVLPKGGTDRDVRWFDTEACYVFHPLNAFEDEGRLILDTPKHPSVYADADQIFGVGVTLERWTVDLGDGRVRQDLVDATPQEFCQLQPNTLGSAHRYGYTVAIGDDTPYEGTRLFKHDLRAGTRHDHDFGPGRHPGEFIFVTDPERADEEDGGWLLGLVHEDASNHTSLAVLDAQNVSGKPVATVDIPRRIPYGLHGLWLNEDT